MVIGKQHRFDFSLDESKSISNDEIAILKKDSPSNLK